MSDRPSPSGRVARAAALVCSLALASVVIVHAQFGCDAPASTEPAPAKGDPVPASPTPSEATPPTANAPAVEAAPEPESKPEQKPLSENKAPVFMPASKSAGDFDSLPLAPPTNAPAKEPPAQQAQQAPQP